MLWKYMCSREWILWTFDLKVSWCNYYPLVLSFCEEDDEKRYYKKKKDKKKNDNEYVKCKMIKIQVYKDKI
jgi:hypothetical protein